MIRMPRFIRAGFALAMLMAAPVGAEVTALVGGTVHPVSGPDIPNGTVLVDGGRITAVGAALQPPAGARIVSCSGKHVYPGMVAANTVLGLVEVNSVRGTVDATEVGDQNPNVRAEVQINPESDLLPVTRVNGITSAVVMPRGGAVAGSAALIKLDGWTYEDMTRAAPLGLFVQWPEKSPGVTDEQRRRRETVLAAIRTAFEDGRAYVQARRAEGKPGVPRHDRDIKWDAMEKALGGSIPMLFQARGVAAIREVLRFADEQGLKRVVLVNANEAWRLADEIKARDIAVITDSMLELPGAGNESYDDAFTVPERLHAAGIRYCISDGGSAFGTYNARNLPYNAAMASAFGLPRDEALKSVTLYPAQILGVADRVGSIEPGKLADRVVTNGDLLEITTQVERVFIDGREVSLETRQSRLFGKYDARPRGAKARPR
jgi:imidazolonepropionase-like amidohydrolase